MPWARRTSSFRYNCSRCSLTSFRSRSISDWKKLQKQLGRYSSLYLSQNNVTSFFLWKFINIVHGIELFSRKRFMSCEGVKSFSEKLFMSREGVRLFSKKMFMSCEGVFYFMNENVYPILPGIWAFLVSWPLLLEWVFHALTSILSFLEQVYLKEGK